MPTPATLTDFRPFQLDYDATARLLRGTWPSSVLDADLRAHYAELLAEARTYGCRFWLLDMRERNWHMPAFGRWYSTEFAAAVRAALGQPVFIAYVLSPSHQAMAESPQVQATQRGAAAHDVYPYFFGDEFAALEWLRHQQAFDAVG